MLKRHFFVGALILALPLAAVEGGFLYQDFLINSFSPPAFRAAASVIAQIPELSVGEYVSAVGRAERVTSRQETALLHDKLLDVLQLYGEVTSLLDPVQVEHVFVFKFEPEGHGPVVLKIPNPYFVSRKELKEFGGPNYSIVRNVERVGRAALIRQMGGSSRVTAPLKELALRQGATSDGSLNDATTVVVSSFVKFALHNGGRAFSDGLSDADVEKIVSCIMLTGMYGLHRGSVMQGIDGKIYFIDLERTHDAILRDDVVRSVEHLITGGIRDNSIARALVCYLFKYTQLTDEQRLAVLQRFCLPVKIDFKNEEQSKAFLKNAPVVLARFLQQLLDNQLISPSIISALKKSDSAPWIVAGCDAVIR